MSVRCYNSECRFNDMCFCEAECDSCTDRVVNRCSNIGEHGVCLSIKVNCVSFDCGGCNQSTARYEPKNQ